jgi:hypothetical protein
MRWSSAMAANARSETLAAFRAYVDRLAASARFCDHHLTVCHLDGGTAPERTALTYGEISPSGFENKAI